MKPDADLAPASTEGRDMTTPLTNAQIEEIRDDIRWGTERTIDLYSLCDTAALVATETGETCEDCDHGIRGGRVCESCDGSGYVTYKALYEATARHVKELRAAALVPDERPESGQAPQKTSEANKQIAAYPHLITIARKTALGSGALADQARALLLELGEL